MEHSAVGDPPDVLATLLSTAGGSASAVFAIASSCHAEGACPPILPEAAIRAASAGALCPVRSSRCGPGHPCSRSCTGRLLPARSYMLALLWLESCAPWVGSRGRLLEWGGERRCRPDVALMRRAVERARAACSIAPSRCIDARAEYCAARPPAGRADSACARARPRCNSVPSRPATACEAECDAITGQGSVRSLHGQARVCQAVTPHMWHRRRQLGCDPCVVGAGAGDEERAAASEGRGAGLAARGRPRGVGGVARSGT